MPATSLPAIVILPRVSVHATSSWDRIDGPLQPPESANDRQQLLTRVPPCSIIVCGAVRPPYGPNRGTAPWEQWTSL